MDILLLTPALPYPPHQGGALRNYGIIHGVHEAGHAVTLLSFNGDSDVPSPTPLDALCKRIEIVSPPVRSSAQRLRDLLTSVQPDLALRLMSAEYSQVLGETLRQQAFDLVQFEGLEMTGYLPIVRQQQPQAKLCYDAHNAEYRLQQVISVVDRRQPSRWPVAIYSFLQARRIASFERAVCQQVDAVIAVSDEDAEALRPFRPDGHIAVVPNGIFMDHYDGTEEQLDLGQHVLTFTGKMDYRPNVDAMLWFTEEVLPLVHAQIPDAHLYIVGQKPHRRLEGLRDRDHISLTGWVNDVTPFLHATNVYVAPLRMGSGTRLKILEAMAAGCAIAATPLAAAGLPDDARSTLVLADNAPQMAEAIVTLLKDDAQQRALGEAARKAVVQHYDWSALIPRLLDTYRGMGLG